PADKKLYALRDVTATVESIPLIASSIMSKKIAEGAGGLVLDVKTGSGAFMSQPELARELAQTMVRIGNDSGLRTRALITAMDVPLGWAIGNALEVQESVDVLAGAGPADVIELTLTLAREMLDLAGIDADPEKTLKDGTAMDCWNRMIRAQGGDPTAALPKSHESQEVLATQSGIITHMDALSLGIAAWRLGAGRARKEDPVSAGAGITLHVKPGDAVQAGDPILTMYADDAARIPQASEALQGAIEVGPADSIVKRLPLILERITG
ncbi:MAG: thymidine phosphorylase, partial [Actinomycetota bacterium]|nr:thymidine phosphorylase [Actinomycetota bacterium]